MLSNAHFLANFRFDTAENEPAKNLKNCVKMFLNVFAKFANFAQQGDATSRDVCVKTLDFELCAEVVRLSGLEDGEVERRGRRAKGCSAGGSGAGRIGKFCELYTTFAKIFF